MCRASLASGSVPDACDQRANDASVLELPRTGRREHARFAMTVAMALAAASAVAASTHEVVWGRLLGRAVGNTSYGVGLTLGLFMFGLGAGTLLAPRLRLWQRPQRGFAIAEVLVGLGATAVLGYCLLAPPASAVVAVSGSAALALDIAAASCVTLLPALAMGTSYPFLVEGVARRREDATAVTALYAAPCSDRGSRWSR